MRVTEVSRRAGLESPGMGDNTFHASLVALKGVQKTPRGTSLYTTRVNRPLGRIIAAGGSVLGLTPNSVTVLNGVVSFAALIVLVCCRPTPLIGVGVGVLLIAGFALDSADGQLARLGHSGSAKGEWFDHMLDCATKVAMHSAVLIAWYRLGRRGPILLLPLAFLLVAVLVFFGGTLVGKLREQSKLSPAEHRGPDWVRAVILLPVDYGVVCCSFLLWGFVHPFAVVYAVLCVAHAVVLVTFSVIWYRELA